MYSVLAKHSLQLPPIKIPPTNFQVFKVEGKPFLITMLKRTEVLRVKRMREEEYTCLIYQEWRWPIDTCIIDSLLSSIKVGDEEMSHY